MNLPCLTKALSERVQLCLWRPSAVAIVDAVRSDLAHKRMRLRRQQELLSTDSRISLFAQQHRVQQGKRTTILLSRRQNARIAKYGDASMHIDGACHCGQISFTAEVDPSRVTLCNCTDCQIQSGSPFRAIVPAPIESFQLRGQPSSYVKVADSGNRRAQMFCPNCGTPLFATAPENATSVNIRLGCVRQRADLVPFAQIWLRSAMPW